MNDFSELKIDDHGLHPHGSETQLQWAQRLGSAVEGVVDEQWKQITAQDAKVIELTQMIELLDKRMNNQAEMVRLLLQMHREQDAVIESLAARLQAVIDWKADS